MRRWGITANSKDMKKLLYVIAAAFCFVACESNTPDGGSKTKDDYVDLGLTSGTKWKAINESNDYGNSVFFYWAIESFEKNIPTKEQWEELIDECTWTWTYRGYKLIGSNGNSITLPAGGYCFEGSELHNSSSTGFYWSSTPSDHENTWGLCFENFEGGVFMLDISRSKYALSVRLVK